MWWGWLEGQIPPFRNGGFYLGSRLPPPYGRFFSTLGSVENIIYLAENGLYAIIALQVLEFLNSWNL